MILLNILVLVFEILYYSMFMYYAKGKQNLKVAGERNHNHKLTENQVKEIYLSKLSLRSLSKKYNVSWTNISHIKKKRQWKWLTDTLDN